MLGAPVGFDPQRELLGQVISQAGRQLSCDAIPVNPAIRDQLSVVVPELELADQICRRHPAMESIPEQELWLQLKFISRLRRFKVERWISEDSPIACRPVDQIGRNRVDSVVRGFELDAGGADQHQQRGVSRTASSARTCRCRSLARCDRR